MRFFITTTIAIIAITDTGVTATVIGIIAVIAIATAVITTRVKNATATGKRR